MVETRGWHAAQVLQIATDLRNSAVASQAMEELGLHEGWQRSMWLSQQLMYRLSQRLQDLPWLKSVAFKGGDGKTSGGVGFDERLTKHFWLEVVGHSGPMEVPHIVDCNASVVGLGKVSVIPATTQLRYLHKDCGYTFVEWTKLSALMRARQNLSSGG